MLSRRGSALCERLEAWNSSSRNIGMDFIKQEQVQLSLDRAGDIQNPLSRRPIKKEWKAKGGGGKTRFVKRRF